jgi:hypothetical protein
MSVVVLSRSEEGGGGSGGIDEDVVFLKFLDVGLNLVHLGLEDFLAALLSNSVQFAVVRLLLVVTHQHLPFLLQSSDQLLTLLLRHEHSLAISLVLLLDLHLANQVVLVINLLLDLSDILGDLAICSLLEHVLLLACRKFWS